MKSQNRNKMTVELVYVWIRVYSCICRHLKNFLFCNLDESEIFIKHRAMDHFFPQAFSAHWFEAWLTLEITRGSFFSSIYCRHFFYSAKQSIAFDYLTFTGTYKPYQQWHTLTKSPALSQQLPITTNLRFLPLQIRYNVFLIFLYCALQSLIPWLLNWNK